MATTTTRAIERNATKVATKANDKATKAKATKATSEPAKPASEPAKPATPLRTVTREIAVYSDLTARDMVDGATIDPSNIANRSLGSNQCPAQAVALMHKGITVAAWLAAFADARAKGKASLPNGTPRGLLAWLARKGVIVVTPTPAAPVVAPKATKGK